MGCHAATRHSDGKKPNPNLENPPHNTHYLKSQMKSSLYSFISKYAYDIQAYSDPDFRHCHATLYQVS